MKTLPISSRRINTRLLVLPKTTPFPQKRFSKTTPLYYPPIKMPDPHIGYIKAKKFDFLW
jgi:hypothetical protein